MAHATISIQGDKASFHDIAAAEYFGNESKRIYCPTFASTIKAITENKAEYGLCAIENSLYGSIDEVYDLLSVSNLRIVGEVYLRVEQELIGLEASSIDQLTTIYSHPVALAQCKHFLDTYLPQVKRIESHDTAGSVEIVKKLNDPHVAAIASSKASELYGLSILKKSIEINNQNYTRFVVLALRDNATTTKKNDNKTTLVLSAGQEVGDLYRALGSFAKRNINLSAIQSRPILGKPWHYSFYIDADLGAHEQTFIEAVDELKEHGCTIRILGSYVGGLKPKSSKLVR